MDSPDPTRRPAAPEPADRDDLLAPATQIVRDREDYLGQGLGDIGRRIADDQVELFVGTDPASALQQHLERLAPEYVALHDIGTSASLRLLRALAGAAGARLQQLSIRRQGHGVALAVLQFVEIPLAGGVPLRIYSTDVNADSQARQQIAMVLLSHSRLGALMVGELPSHALATALQPMRDALARGPWPNRELLLLPLGSPTALAAQAAQLGGASGVVIRVTPTATRPNDAWTFVSGAWNRLHGTAAGGTALDTELSRAVPRPAVPRPEAPTQPMPLTPSPPPLPSPSALRAAPASTYPFPPVAPPSTGFSPAPMATSAHWAEYAQRCGAIKGVVGCCVVDTTFRRLLAHTGQAAPPERLAEQGRVLLEAMAASALALGLGEAPPEAAISVGAQHLLLRPVPGHPGVVLHLLLHAGGNSLTLARLQLERIAAPA